MRENVIHGKEMFAMPPPASPKPNARGRYFSKYKPIITIPDAYAIPEPIPKRIQIGCTCDSCDGPMQK